MKFTLNNGKVTASDYLGIDPITGKKSYPISITDQPMEKVKKAVENGNLLEILDEIQGRDDDGFHGIDNGWPEFEEKIRHSASLARGWVI